MKTYVDFAVYFTCVSGDHDGSHHECQPACYLHAKRLQSFDVTRCNQNFRLLDSSLLIRFRDTNSLDEVTEPVILLSLLKRCNICLFIWVEDWQSIMYKLLEYPELMRLCLYIQII